MSDDPTQSIAPIAPVPAPPAAGLSSSVIEPAPPSHEPVRPVTGATMAAAAPRKGSSGRWLNVLLGVAAIVAIGGVAFAIGRSTAPASATGFPGNGTFRGNFGNGAIPNGAIPNASGAPGFGNGTGRALGLGGGGVTVKGTVKAVNGDTMTITTASGQTVDVKTSGDTAYHQQTAATATDVTVGTGVSIQVDFGGFGRGQGANGNGGPAGSGTTGNGTAASPTLTATDVTVVP